jgi:hypothetical protein
METKAVYEVKFGEDVRTSASVYFPPWTDREAVDKFVGLIEPSYKSVVVSQTTTKWEVVKG